MRNIYYMKNMPPVSCLKYFIIIFDYYYIASFITVKVFHGLIMKVF